MAQDLREEMVLAAMRVVPVGPESTPKSHAETVLAFAEATITEMCSTYGHVGRDQSYGHKCRRCGR